MGRKSRIRDVCRLLIIVGEGDKGGMFVSFFSNISLGSLQSRIIAPSKLLSNVDVEGGSIVGVLYGNFSDNFDVRQ